MQHEYLSIALSKEKRKRLLTVGVLLLLCPSQAALAQSGRRQVTKEPQQPTVSAEAKIENEKPKSDDGKVYTRKQPPRSEWQLLAPAGEEFSIMMPVLSDVYRTTRYVDLGSLGSQMVNVQVYRSLTDQGIFVVQSFEGSDLKVLEEDIVKNNKQLSFVDDVKVNGYKGKSFKRKGLTSFGRGQYFRTKKHLYVIEVVRKVGDDPSIDEFLRSLTLGVPNPTTTLKVEPIPQSDVILNSREVTRKATILWRSTPTYIPEARQRGERGRISLRALFSSNGIVTDIELRSGLGNGLNAQAVAAANAIIFIPAEKDGEYVSQWVQIDYDFHIY